MRWFQALFSASQAARTPAAMPGVTALKALASAPRGACSRSKAPVRPGATAEVGSTRTQPRPASQTSVQAWASLCRTAQKPSTELRSPPW